MTEGPAVRRVPPQAQSSGSIHTLMTSRQPYMSEPIASKRVCFYKSGDAQFSGLPVIINNRTFKTFEALLDSLSKRVPLPFGVRTITTPRGHTTVRSLDQLHHGHSYICSDKRTVKPIDLERAQRKPPPWYHARPVSSRRLTRDRQSPGPRSTRRARRNEHAALLPTPKRLVVFRNGDPEVKHTLLLQKRTTHSFEALLDLVSEVMCFPVLKLHTPDGRRVDGLPALILCSGVLVAAGREAFRKANYDVQKPSAPTWLPAKSVGRLQPVSRKKKSTTSSTKSRPFSPSSERYIVNQIHNSFAGSAYNYTCNPTGSVEMETGQLLESVAETDTIVCMDGDGEEDSHMPNEDDIEKSFRVNQDGSMTVEMKVRLTIKEEEMIHWTTTLSRSSVANQIKTVSELHSDLGAHLSDKIPSGVSPGISEVIQNCSVEPAFANERNEEMEPDKIEQIMTVKETLKSVPSTPEWCKVEQKQSVGSTMKVTETEIQENVLESYAYKEETSNGEMKQEHCMIRQCRSRPVPKPRSILPSELTSTTSQLQSDTYKPAEILQLQDRGEEVHETVLHIYEQQTCQENFFANTQLCLQGRGTYSSPSGRPGSSDAVFPASSKKTVYSSGKDLEYEPRAFSMYGSLNGQSDLCKKTLPQEIGKKKSRTSNLVTEFPKPPEHKTILPVTTCDTSQRRKPVRVIVKKNHIFQIAAPEWKQKHNKADTLKEIKKIRADIFGRAGTTRRTEHYRAKAVHKLLKRRNNLANQQESIPSMLHSPVQLSVQSLNELSSEKEPHNNETKAVQAGMFCRKSNESSSSPKKDLLCATSSKCVLTRQTSMHEERDLQRETRELSESISLPALHSSSSVFNEYVELWLQKNEYDQEQVLSTHGELQENTTFLTPQEGQASPEVSAITCEPRGSTETSTEDIPLVSLDNRSYQQNLSSTKSSMEQQVFSMKETLPSNSSTEMTSSQENTSLPKNVKNDTFSSEHITESTSSQINAVERIPLPRNLSLKKKLWNKNTSLDDSSEKEITQNVSHGEASLEGNVPVKSSDGTSDNTSAFGKSTLEFSKLTSNQDIIAVPRNTIMSSQSKESKSETNTDTTLEKISTDNEHVKQTSIPRNPSSEKTLLPNQPSVEKIPRNNTLTMALLFNQQKNVEKTPLSAKVPSENMSGPIHSSLKKLSESKRISVGKSQVSSDATKTRETEQCTTPHGNSRSSESNTSTSLRADADVKPSVEMTVLQVEKSYTVKMAVRPDMRHVLDKLCHSIQSLREVTQHKQRSCLEKSNSLPDFSSHLASTFGSSSRVLLAFLSVMTLKDGLANLNTCRQAQNLSCSEALLMLQSLREMAAIEDAEQLRASLNALQNSVSVQLLQSWKGFQELSNIIRSHSVTSDSSQTGSYSESCSEEEVIQGLMEDLGVPDRVREELAALCTQQEESIRGNHMDGLEKPSESLPGVKMNGFTSFLEEKPVSFTDSGIEKDVNMYVKSVIEKAVEAHLGNCGISNGSMTHLLGPAEKEIKVVTDKKEREFSQIMRTKPMDRMLDFDNSNVESPHESLLEEKQQKIEDMAVDPMKTEGRGMVAVGYYREQEMDDKPQHYEKENEEMEERTVCEGCNAKAKHILDENLKYLRVLHNDEGNDAVKKMTGDKDIYESRVTEKQPKSFESTSTSEDKLTTSEEDKDSIGEEDDSCDEELMSFSEDRVSDKEENNEINSTELNSIEQNSNLREFQPCLQGEDQVTHTISQCQSKTDFVENQSEAPKMQDILLSIHEESHVKLDLTQHDTEQQKTIYDQRMIYSEGEQVVLEAPECYTIYQEHFVEKQEHGPGEPIEYEETALNLNEKIKKSVAELINSMESVAPIVSNIPKVRTQNKSKSERHSQKVLPKESQKMMKSHVDLTSEPLSSSLAFSYDSRSSSLAQEPEGNIQVNRVRSIREMFLAKTNTRSQNGQRKLHSANSDVSDCQTESTDSGGNQSQTSPDTSGGEDDNSQLAIAKGFVKRTIERLYGRGNSNSTGPEEKRPQSASKGKKREGLGRANVTTLASLHEARTQVKTDLTYYNAKSSFDVLNEPTHCVTLNAQVGPGDAVLIDKGRWLFRGNQPICESTPELQESLRNVENNTNIVVDPEQDTMIKEVPYSLFCPVSPHSTAPSTELEELTDSSGSKFTYFKLPNASDSELEPEVQNADTPAKTEAKVTPVTQSFTSWAEKNSFLPAFNPPVIKKADNKVHPLLEAISPPVVTQPARGQSAQTEVARRSTEPDVLEMLFIFCGQHCPIL